MNTKKGTSIHSGKNTQTVKKNSKNGTKRLKHKLITKKISKTISSAKKQKHSKFIPSQIRNIAVELKDIQSVDTDYKWKVVKSKQEEIFADNYPVDLLLACNQKLKSFISELASNKKIHIQNTKNIPENILVELKNSMDNVYTYSSLNSGLRSEYNNQNKNEFPYNNANNLVKTNKLLQHRFVYTFTLSYYYINDVYNLLPINLDKDFKILNISHHKGYAEACIYKYINQTPLENINTNIDSLITGFVFCKNFKEDEIKNINRIYKYDNYDIIKKYWSPADLDKIIIDRQSSKDLCFLDCHMFIKGYEFIRINYNHQLLLGGLIIALCSLKQNGNLLLSLAGLSSKFSQDLIVIVNQYFDKLVLFKHELYKPHYNTYFIACYGFRNKAIDNFTQDIEMMKQIYAEMYNLDNTGGLAYTPNSPKEESLLGITRHQSSHQKPNAGNYTYFNSLLEPNNSIIYDLITRHIEDRLRDYEQFLDAMNFYHDNIRLNNDKHRQYQMINYYKSIQMAKYLNLQINPTVNVFKIKTDITTDIYQNLYGLDTTVHFKFRAYPNNKLIYGKPKLELSNQNLLEQILRMNTATRIFDTRNLDNYDLLKKKLRFYENSLNGLLMDKFNNGIPTKKNKVIRQPSRAWIKMYEIAEIAQLIPRQAPKFKVLCFCEAPGNFILAINHYVKTKTDIKKFDWIAQSYNPNAQGPRDYHVIGDDYELMKNYPDNWDFGPKNTGDITDATNIKYYGTVYDDVDLLTADCGTDWGDNDLFSSKLMYGQLLFILNSLPIGKSFVIKYYVPFIHYPAQLALFYIIYQSFEEISFYKPLQNAWSPEFYLIGKGYKGINRDLLAHLFDTLNNYNPFLSPIDLQKIPQNFSLQLEKVVCDLVDRFVFYIERYIYYIDIIEEGGNPRFNLVEEHINMRNEEWIKKFKILKIKDGDKL